MTSRGSSKTDLQRFPNSDLIAVDESRTVEIWMAKMVRLKLSEHAVQGLSTSSN